MTASLPMQLAPIYYLAGAVVVAVVIILAITIRHRRPKSLEANVESFNRGLRALSPDAPAKRRRRRPPAPVASSPSLARSVAPSSATARSNRVVTSTVTARRSGSEADAG